MSKDFESEYREYQKMSAPDLWDRIEAGIDICEEEKTESKKVVNFPIRKMATIAAACFTIIICIPALGILMQVFGGSKKSADSVIMNEMASAECETVCEEEYFATESMFDSQPSEAPADMEENSFVYNQEETIGVTTEKAEVEDGTIVSEELILEVVIREVEAFGNERKYLATDMETQELITIIQDAEFEPMEEDTEYTISVTKTEENVYYFMDVMVE